MTPTFRSILQDVSAASGVTLDQILSADRTKRVFRARAAACWIARNRGMTFVAIGRELRRDHSTIIHAVRVAAAMKGGAK